MSDDWQVVEEALGESRITEDDWKLVLEAFARLRERNENLERYRQDTDGALDRAQEECARLREREAQEAGYYDKALRALNAAEARVAELGNELAAERSKDGGTFDQWHRLQRAEVRVARLEEALENECREAEHRAATWPEEYSLLVPVDAIRRALAHEEEK